MIIFKIKGDEANNKNPLSSQNIHTSYDAHAIKIDNDKFIVIDDAKGELKKINTGNYELDNNEVICFSSQYLNEIDKNKDFVLEDFHIKNNLFKDIDIDINSAIELKSILIKEVSLIDVRSLEEYDSGHIKDAINIDVASIQHDISNFKDKDELLIIYCRSGNRSNHAQRILENLGYTVLDAGGLNDYEGKLTK